MNFVFWQNALSIHQSAFIKALSKKHHVRLVVESEMSPGRKEAGWHSPDMGDATITVRPSEGEIEELIRLKDTHHVFSGIDAFPIVYKAFKKAISARADISVMMEPYQWKGMKGKLRRLKYFLHAIRYGCQIKHVFATGELGVKAFIKAGFPKSRIHEWGYFTEVPDISITKCNTSPRIIFVGSIDERKNILSLVDAAKNNESLFSDFIIVGVGPLENELKRSIVSCPKIHYVGRLPNQTVAQFIASCDLLVLPSLFDGWGAVVNEALSVGTRVLCSDNCGAASLLDNDSRGGSFRLEDNDSLNIELKKWLQKGPLTTDQREQIRKWAKTKISGESAGEYLAGVISKQSIDTPWVTPPPHKNASMRTKPGFQTISQDRE